MQQTQCAQLDSRFLRVLVPRCGYNRNMHRAIRYAPMSMGGAGFKQLYVEQGSLLLQQIFKHLNQPNTAVGKLLRIAISWTQAFIGTSNLFLTEVHQPVPPTGPSLLLDLRKFLQTIEGQLKVNDMEHSVPLRRNDRYIMDIVMTQTRWTKKQIIQINSCRRYIQAQTLADICNMQGTRIQPFAYTPINHDNGNKVRISQFNQQQPGPQAWKTWKRFLRSIADSNGVLISPLGDWTVDVTKTRRWPTYLYDPTTDQMYSHEDGDTYRLHHQIRAGVYCIEPTGPTYPAVGYPVFTYHVNGTMRITKNFAAQPQHRQIPAFIRIQPSYRQHDLETWEAEILQQCHLLQSEEFIKTQALIGNITSCSDGSATTEAGSFGFVISTKQGLRLATGKGEAPGSRPNSFRSEAYGVLATMRLLYRLLKGMETPTPPTMQHYLDNRSVTHRIKKTLKTWHRNPNQGLQPEQDVINEIATTLKQLPVFVDMEWVKGHQNSRTPYTSLPLNAQLNCDADVEATNARQAILQQQQTVPPLPSTPCQLIIQGKSVTRRIKRNVQEVASISNHKQYLKGQFSWDEDTYNTIDWQLFQETLPKYRDQWPTIVKHIHDISPTGHIAHRNNPHLSHACPACSSPQEDNQHVLQCPHPSRLDWRASTMDQLQNNLSQESNPVLIDILLDGLMRFHRRLPEIQLQQYPQQYHTLIIEQNRIGWEQLYMARWSKEWRRHQTAYTDRQQNNGKQSKGHQWSLSFSRLLINQWLKLWKLRNTQRHGQDEAQRTHIRRQVLTATLKELYEYREKVCPIDRHIFFCYSRGTHGFTHISG